MKILSSKLFHWYQLSWSNKFSNKYILPMKKLGYIYNSWIFYISSEFSDLILYFQVGKLPIIPDTHHYVVFWRLQDLYIKLFVFVVVEIHLMHINVSCSLWHYNICNVYMCIFRISWIPACFVSFRFCFVSCFTITLNTWFFQYYAFNLRCLFRCNTTKHGYQLVLIIKP